MEITFDPAKNAANLQKHGIDFTAVDPVFYDQNALTLEDRDHDEERFVVMGMDAMGRIVVVAYCYDEMDETAIRVISARLAEPHERREYDR